jgi:hypothetical protein
MLKNFSNDAIVFMSAWISAGLAFCGLWGVIAYFHFKMGRHFAVTTDPHDGWDYFFNVAFIVSLIYLAGWLVFSLVHIGGSIYDWMLYRKNRPVTARSSPVSWFIFLAARRVVYSCVF